MPVTIGPQVTLDFSTLRKLVPNTSASRESWIAAIEEACKTFPANIPPKFMMALGTIPKIVDYFSHSLDISNHTANYVMMPGMWVELPEKRVEKELLYWGLLCNSFSTTYWASAEVTFDGIEHHRRPQGLEVEIFNLDQLLDKTGLTPQEVIDNLVSFWSTLESRIQDMLSGVKSKIACLEFPWLLAQLAQIPAE